MNSIVYAMFSLWWTMFCLLNVSVYVFLCMCIEYLFHCFRSFAHILMDFVFFFSIHCISSMDSDVLYLVSSTCFMYCNFFGIILYRLWCWLFLHSQTFNLCTNAIVLPMNKRIFLNGTHGGLYVTFQPLCWRRSERWTYTAVLQYISLT